MDSKEQSSAAHVESDQQDVLPEDKQRIEEQMDKLRDLVEKDFERAITQLINEIDLLFDYVPADIKAKLHKYCERVCSDKDFKRSEMKIILDKLKPFEDKIYQISVVKKKTKTSDLEFLDTLVLFEDNLQMSVFSHENKNTKISIVNYISSMYMAASFGSFGMGGNFNMDELSNELTNFVESIKQKAELTTNPKPVPKRAQRTDGASSSRGASQDSMGGLLSTIMSNPDIMNMAADLTQDLQNQNVDPLSLMTSLMSGTPNGQLNNIVSKITNKLEEKLSTGELNKVALEQQAEQIMSVVQSSDLASQVPMLQHLLQNSTSINNIKKPNNKHNRNKKKFLMDI